LVKNQWGFAVLPDNYRYLDAVRILYKQVSDIPSLRLRKNRGYSRRSPLNEVARAILLNLFTEAEKLSGIKLYGLDEARTAGGHTLREVFYELDPETSMES